jgi:hypothetical protein
MSYNFFPVTPERWTDFEQLFGINGARGGCWCMLWRLPRKEFEAAKGRGNQSAMKGIVLCGDVPGLLAYNAAEPIAWYAVAPRNRYQHLNDRES